MEQQQKMMDLPYRFNVHQNVVQQPIKKNGVEHKA